MSTVKQEERKKGNRPFIIVLILLVVGGGAFGITKYIHAQHHEETDDAQIEANISPVIPRVPGYVKEVRVKDNQLVKKGDTLIVLDERDMQLKLQQAEAALAIAKSNLTAVKANSSAANAGVASVRATVGTIDAQIETAKINVWRTTQDLSRYENLIKDHSITQQQYEQAEAAKQTADRQLQVLIEQRKQALEQTNTASSQSGATSQQIGVADATIRQREVEVENAQLNLSYTVIIAPESGTVSKINVQEGQYLQAGQSLFSVVLDKNIWVVANFKETQLEKMKIGQKVIVHVDAFHKHEFNATLTSFSPATGARFSLLPPDNATGNFVRVVQRLPVKIEFDKTDPLIEKLRPGMNVDVDVHLD